MLPHYNNAKSALQGPGPGDPIYLQHYVVSVQSEEELFSDMSDEIFKLEIKNFAIKLYLNINDNTVSSFLERAQKIKHITIEIHNKKREIVHTGKYEVTEYLGFCYNLTWEGASNITPLILEYKFKDITDYDTIE